MFAGIVLAGAVGLAAAITLDVIADRVFHKSVWIDTDTWQGRSLHLAVAGTLLPCILAIAFTPYQWALRRSVGKLLVRTVCGRCAYSLQGLPINAGTVLCPECGLAVNLKAAGLTPEAIALGRPIANPRVQPIPEQLAPYWYVPLASALSFGPAAGWIIFPMPWLLPFMVLGAALLVAGPGLWIAVHRTHK
jgi:hypothetical protein